MEPFDLRLWPGFVKAGGQASSSPIIDQIAIDSRRIASQNALFVALSGTMDDGHRFVSQAATLGARYALVKHEWNPSVLPQELTLLRVDDPLRAFQEIAHCYRKQLSVKIIGIAGSYGKTMVKDLLQTLTSQTKKVVASPESFNSQIGVPLSLLTIGKEHELAIIEAGISKKDEMDILANLIAPDYGILTHIGKKHLATLKDIRITAAETIKLLSAIPSDGWSILPKDGLTLPLISEIKAKSYFWNEPTHSLPHASSVAKSYSTSMPYHINFPNEQTYLGKATTGFYYFLDLINITIKAAWLLGVPASVIQNTLENYIPEPMRTEIWKSSIGTTFINDFYCSDPQSVDHALRYFDQSKPNSRKVFIFSGMRGKRQHPDSDYRRIGKAIHRSQVNMLMLVGPHDFASLYDEVKRHAPQTEILLHKTYQEALAQLRSRIAHEDVVLIKGERKEPLDKLTSTFNDSICNNQCIINLAAIQANISSIRHKVSKGTRILVMVKALAYGTDDVRMSKFLATCNVDILGVSYVDEGVALKRAGVTQEIFVINAASYEASKVVKWGLQVGVSDLHLIEALAQEAQNQNKKIKVHLHVDTGMSRFGCRPEEALQLAQRIVNSPFLHLEGLMTHFACADNPAEDAFTKSQAECFENVITTLKAHEINPPWLHAANSSAAIRFKFPKFNMIRIGLAVYGLYSSEATKAALDLRLALSLHSRIVGINVCKAGESISYGRSYTVAREEQRIAVLPIGYFDGLHRNYSGKGHVIIRGHKAPMVGKICMDFMMVDVTDVPNVSVGDPVLIFGEDEYGQYLSPEDLAMRGDSIVYELITCLGPRIQRIFVYEEAQNQR
jgi:Alr-MurF fusion protein